MYKNPNESIRHLLKIYLSNKSIENRNALIELFYPKIKEKIELEHTYLKEEEKEDLLNSVTVDLMNYLEKVKLNNQENVHSESLYKFINFYISRYIKRLKKIQKNETSLEEILRNKYNQPIDNNKFDRTTKGNAIDNLLMSNPINISLQEPEIFTDTEIRDALPLIAKKYGNNRKNYKFLIFCDYIGINPENVQENRKPLNIEELMAKYGFANSTIYNYIQYFASSVKIYLLTQDSESNIDEDTISSSEKTTENKEFNKHNYILTFLEKKKKYYNRRKDDNKPLNMFEFIKF